MKLRIARKVIKLNKLDKESDLAELFNSLPRNQELADILSGIWFSRYNKRTLLTATRKVSSGASK